MSNLRSVYVTAHGSYPTGAWVGEGAQIGVRLAFVPTLDAPDKGDIFTPTEGGEITADFGVLAGAHGSLTKTWKARIGDTGSDENMNAAAQVDMAEDMWAFLNAVKYYQAPEFKWTHVKVSAVDTTGHTPRESSIYTFGTPLAGTGSGSALPPQVALAVSTRANLVGRRGRGRIYLPAVTSGILATDGTANTTQTNAIRGYFKTLLDALQALPGLTQFMPILFVGSNDSATVVRPVELRTGNRLDTIQSRRRQVVESYQTTAL